MTRAAWSLPLHQFQCIVSIGTVCGKPAPTRMNTGEKIVARIISI